MGVEEGAFSRELYMSVDQMKYMVSAGMHIGSHGYDHYWLGSLSKEKQEVEIKESLKFITTKSYILSQNSSTVKGNFGRFYEGENGDVVIDEKEVMGTDRGEGIIRNQTLYITYVPKKEGKHEINIGFKRESPSKEFYFPYTIVCKK